MVIALSASTNAQLLEKTIKKVGKKVEKEAEKRTDQKINKGIDKAFDKAEEGVDSTVKGDGTNNQKQPAQQGKPKQGAIDMAIFFLLASSPNTSLFSSTKR